MSTRLPFRKLYNTRDLGGMRTADGRVVRSGLLVRSGHLSGLDAADAAQLRALVHTVIDFRTQTEREEQPDTELAGVRNIHLPVVDSLTAGISREEASDRDVISIFLQKPDEAKDYMCGLYRRFAEDWSVRQYSLFLAYLLHAEGGVLWHCTAGKDRAGMAAIIVEEILGVPREDIIADYMVTNRYLEDDIRMLTARVKEQTGVDSGKADASLRYLFGAEEAYIEAFSTAVRERFGGIDGFLRDGLGVDDAMRNAFRARYLE